MKPLRPKAGVRVEKHLINGSGRAARRGTAEGHRGCAGRDAGGDARQPAPRGRRLLKFHLALAEASNNDYYASAMLTLKEHINIGMTFHGMPLIGRGRNLEHVYKEHVDLWTALRNRDGERARRLMQLHLEVSCSTYRSDHSSAPCNTRHMAH
jgi:DNA-binding FadR family transcriptional regulator